MKAQKLFFILGIAIISASTAYAQNQSPAISLMKPAPQISNTYNPNRVILSKNYHVYVLGKTVLNRPAPGPYPGFKEKILPTYNFYKGHPGCYVACYSNQAANSIFPINDTIFVKGQIRVPGHYQGKICYPSGNVHKEMAENVYLKNLCRKYLKSCRTAKCWANGNTGGWLGIR